MLSLFPLASNVSHTVGGNRSCDNYSENYLAVCTKVIFLYRSWGSHGKYTGVVCHSLLQWITICLNSPLWTVCLGWALHSMAYSFIELHKPLHHDKTVIHINKVSGYNEIPAELFTSLKEEAMKVLHSLCQQIWKTQQWPQDWIRSILIPIPKKGNTKECANTPDNRTHLPHQ